MPWELLYADDLWSLQTPRRSVSPNSRHGRLAWRVRKTKFVVSGVDIGVLKNQASIPVLSAARALATTPSRSHSGGCGSTRNIIKWLVDDENNICPRCKGESRPIDYRPMTQVDVKCTKLDVEANFCYLGDMLCSGGGCDSTIAARCCVALGKLRKLLPVHTSSHLSTEVPGKVYAACVCLAMFHRSKVKDLNIWFVPQSAHEYIKLSFIGNT